jgi:four helix bundle protein
MARFLSKGHGMHPHQPEDLSERSFQFACDVYDYCDDLVRLKGLPCRVAYQLFDAGSSVGANRSEAKSSYSDKEFAAKNAICLKECREARFWLRLAEAKSLGNQSTRTRLLGEAEQLIRIYSSTVRTLKARLSNDGPTGDALRDPPTVRRPRTRPRSFKFEVPDGAAKKDVRKPPSEK